MKTKQIIVKQIKTENDLKELSYYTLCRLQDFTHYANPIKALPIVIKQGEFKGILTLDKYGNYLSFE